MTSAVWNPADPRVVRELAARHPLVTALLLSLLLHVAFYGFYKLGNQYGWWDYQATWLLQRAKAKAAALAEKARQRQSQTREIPLEFVEVDPADAVVEPPKEAKYYAAHSTVASNPDALQETPAPKIDGTQDKVMRTEDVPKPKPFPLQPAAESPPAEEVKAAEPIGDLALRRPETAEAPAQRERPRTLAQARAQRNLAGPKTLQQGGVRNRGKIAVDAKGSLFGTYDAAFIAAVQQRWYDLLDTTPYVQRSGKVVLEFRLNQDGRITDMQMSNNEVGDILAFVCQRAVTDPSPFGKWPDDMRRMVGNTYREVTFTFYYN
jgi:hypothetical protein